MAEETNSHLGIWEAAQVSHFSFEKSFVEGFFYSKLFPEQCNKKKEKGNNLEKFTAAACQMTHVIAWWELSTNFDTTPSRVKLSWGEIKFLGIPYVNAIGRWCSKIAFNVIIPKIKNVEWKQEQRWISCVISPAMMMQLRVAFSYLFSTQFQIHSSSK